MKSRKKKQSSSGEPWDRLLAVTSSRFDGINMAGVAAPPGHTAGPSPTCLPGQQPQQHHVRQERSQADLGIAHILAGLAGSASPPPADPVFPSLPGQMQINRNPAMDFAAPTRGELQQHHTQHSQAEPQLGPHHRQSSVLSNSMNEAMKQENRFSSTPLAMEMTMSRPIFSAQSLPNGYQNLTPPPSRACACQGDIPDSILQILDLPSAPLIEHLQNYMPCQPKMCQSHRDLFTSKILNCLMDKEAQRQAAERASAAAIASNSARHSSYMPFVLSPLAADGAPLQWRSDSQGVNGEGCNSSYFECVVTGDRLLHHLRLDAARSPPLSQPQPEYQPPPRAPSQAELYNGNRLQHPQIDRSSEPQIRVKGPSGQDAPAVQDAPRRGVPMHDIPRQDNCVLAVPGQGAPRTEPQTFIPTGTGHPGFILQNHAGQESGFQMPNIQRPENQKDGCEVPVTQTAPGQAVNTQNTDILKPSLQKVDMRRYNSQGLHVQRLETEVSDLSGCDAGKSALRQPRGLSNGVPVHAASGIDSHVPDLQAPGPPRPESKAPDIQLEPGTHSLGEEKPSGPIPDMQMPDTHKPEMRQLGMYRPDSQRPDNLKPTGLMYGGLSHHPSRLDSPTFDLRPHDHPVRNGQVAGAARFDLPVLRGPQFDAMRYSAPTIKQHGFGDPWLVAPKLDTARDDEFRRQVMQELQARPGLQNGKSHGDTTGRQIYGLLQVATSPSADEALVLSGREAAARVENGVIDCPIFTEGQQAFMWDCTTRPIAELFQRMEALDRNVAVQIPSRNCHRPTFENRKLSVIRERFLESGNPAPDDPWNILDLRSPLPATIIPRFLTGQNCQLLLRVRDAVLNGSSGERTVAAKEKWNEWLDVTEWVLMSEGGHNTAPHMDSHGLSTWITLQEGQFGFGWLSRPTKEEMDAWVADPHEFIGGRWRFTVLTPGRTVFFPSGTVHFVFRLRHGQTLALGGHILQWTGVERWINVVREQMMHAHITNEDVEWSAPRYVKVIADLVMNRVRNGRVNELGGQEMVDRFLAVLETFDEDMKNRPKPPKSSSKKRKR